jgi:MA3 domain
MHMGPLQTQMRKGFERVAADMPDIRLDLPNAPAAFGDFQKQVRSCASVSVSAAWHRRGSASQQVCMSRPTTHGV